MKKLRVNDVDVDEVSLKHLQRFQQKNGEGKYFLTLPKYQRGVVWSQAQKEALVDSIYSGFPIGSLLGFQPSGEHGRGGGRDVIQVVCAPHRPTTLIEYLKSPLLFASPLQLFGSDVIADLARKILGTDSEDNF